LFINSVGTIEPDLVRQLPANAAQHDPHQLLEEPADNWLPFS
jgi:hypothetical protein